MNTERLLHLVEILNEVPRKKFNLAIWLNNSSNDNQNISCDTVGCAIGWACLDEEFQEAGLTFDYEHGVPTYGEEISYKAASSFFDISVHEAELLFDPYYYRASYHTHPPTVAKRIRKFVENGKISVY